MGIERSCLMFAASCLLLIAILVEAGTAPTTSTIFLRYGLSLLSGWLVAHAHRAQTR